MPQSKREQLAGDHPYAKNICNGPSGKCPEGYEPHLFNKKEGMCRNCGYVHPFADAVEDDSVVPDNQGSGPGPDDNGGAASPPPAPAFESQSRSADAPVAAPPPPPPPPATVDQAAIPASAPPPPAPPPPPPALEEPVAKPPSHPALPPAVPSPTPSQAQAQSMAAETPPQEQLGSKTNHKNEPGHRPVPENHNNKIQSLRKLSRRISTRLRRGSEERPNDAKKPKGRRGSKRNASRRSIVSQNQSGTWKQRKGEGG